MGVGNRFATFACASILSAGAMTVSQQRLTLPYESPGVCPFECCKYRTWTVEEDTRILAERRDGAPVRFTVRRGEHVKGVTGVVVTTRFGRAVAGSSRRLGVRRQLVKPGDELQVIHYLGEGTWKYWFQGSVDQDFLPDPDNCARSSKSSREMLAACAVQIVEKPTTTWWVKIRSRGAKDGWTQQVDHFSKIDACGG